ncbi:MAG: tetratricopeptide repeat protein [Planctomycetota bacterium]
MPSTKPAHSPLIVLTLAGPTFLALVLALPAASGGFVLDDLHIVREDARLASLTNVPSLFIDNYWGDFSACGLYRPLTLTSFALERALWGVGSAAPYHITNAILYAVATLLIALIALRLNCSAGAALVATALFACHPVHTEAVVPIVGRSELGCLIFLLFGIFVALGRDSRRPSWKRALGITICFLGSILCKETGIALLPLLFVVALTQSPSGNAPERARGWLAHLVDGWRVWLLLLSAFGIWFALRHIALSDGVLPASELNNLLASRDGMGRLAGGLATTCKYFGMLLWSWPLSSDYSLRALDPPSSLWAFSSLLGLALWLAVGVGIGYGITRLIATNRGAANGAASDAVRVRTITLGLAIIGACLLPVANMFFATGTIFAERLLFSPSAGFALVTAGLFHTVWSASRVRRGLAMTVTLGACTLGATGFLVRIPDWRDELSLARSIVQTQPLSAKGHEKLGWELRNLALKSGTPQTERDRLLAEAEHELSRAVEICPTYENAWLNLSIVYLQRNKLVEWEAAARQHAALDPASVQAYANMAHVHFRAQRFDEALRVADAGLARWPTQRQLRRRRYDALVGLGRQAEAMPLLEELCRDPDADLMLLLVQAQHRAMQGDFAGARRSLDQLIATPPDHPQFELAQLELPAYYNNRGLTHASEGRHAAALADYNSALALRSEFTLALGNKTAALIALNRLDEADAVLAELARVAGENAAAPLRAQLAKRRAQTTAPPSGPRKINFTVGG